MPERRLGIFAVGDLVAVSFRLVPDSALPMLWRAILGWFSGSRVDACIQDLLLPKVLRVLRVLAVRQTSLLDTVWIEVKDGNDTARDIFSNHYSADERLRNGSILRGSELLMVGPGEKIVLVTPCARAAFAWRKEKHRMDGQTGVNCAFFRNEGAGSRTTLVRIQPPGPNLRATLP